MIDAARRIDAALSRAAAEIEALRAGEIGLVTLGVVSTGKYFAPSLVRALMGAVPRRANCAAGRANREATIEGLATGALDLAIMGRPPRKPAVDAVPLGPHPHGIVLPRGHRLDGRRGVSAAELAGETFIAREMGSGTRILMTRYLDRIGEGLEFQTVEMDSNETIKQAVMAGLGIAFLSLHTAVEELRAGRLRLLDAPACRSRGLGIWSAGRMTARRPWPSESRARSPEPPARCCRGCPGTRAPAISPRPVSARALARCPRAFCGARGGGIVAAAASYRPLVRMRPRPSRYRGPGDHRVPVLVDVSAVLQSSPIAFTPDLRHVAEDGRLFRFRRRGLLAACLEVHLVSGRPPAGATFAPSARATCRLAPTSTACNCPHVRA